MGRSPGHAARAHLHQPLSQLHFRAGFISSLKKLDSAEREASFWRLTTRLGADPIKSGLMEGAHGTMTQCSHLFETLP